MTFALINSHLKDFSFPIESSAHQFVSSKVNVFPSNHPKTIIHSTIKFDLDVWPSDLIINSHLSFLNHAESNHNTRPSDLHLWQTTLKSIGVIISSKYPEYQIRWLWFKVFSWYCAENEFMILGPLTLTFDLKIKRHVHFFQCHQTIILDDHE